MLRSIDESEENEPIEGRLADHLDGTLHEHHEDALWRTARLEPRLLDRIDRELSDDATTDSAVEPTIEEVRRARRSADRARDLFVIANRGLVYMLAKRHLDQGLELGDLVQEGTLGLLRAIDKFDHSLGHRFSTYASWWIRHALARAIANQASTIRIPVHLLESRRKLRRVRQALSAESTSEPTTEELEKATGLSAEKIRTVSELVREPLRLESPVGDEGDATLATMVADPNAPRPDQEVADAHLATQLRKLIETLSPREQIVLRKRFGIDETDRTLTEVGKSFGVSRERVRQIESAALSKLRKASERLELHSHLERESVP